jgi:hypothetical protein
MRNMTTPIRLPFPTAITPPSAKKNATTSMPAPAHRAAVAMQRGYSGWIRRVNGSGEWGTRELGLRDLNGYFLTFTEPGRLVISGATRGALRSCGGKSARSGVARSRPLAGTSGYCLERISMPDRGREARSHHFACAA